MKHRFLFHPALCAAAALTLTAGFAAPVARAQDDASALLDGAQKGIEKIKKEMKAQSETRKLIKDIEAQLKAVNEKQAELAKNLEALQQSRRESEASSSRQADKIQHLSRQVEHMEAEMQKCMESMSKALVSPTPSAPPGMQPAAPTPPVQQTPGPTPAAEPSPAS